MNPRIKLFLLMIHISTLATGKELSLNEALDLSRSYWATRLGQSQIEAEASSAIAKTGSYLPDVNAGLNMGKDYLVTPSQDFQASAFLELNQPIVNVSNWISIEARNAETISQTCQTESDQLDISKQVIQFFIEALQNQDEDRLQIKRSTKLSKMVQLLRETTKLRLASQADLYQAESQVVQIDIDRAQFGAGKIAASNNLRTLLGLPAQENLTLESKFIDEPNDFKDWKEWAAHIPSVVVLESRVKAASKDIAATRWELFPEVGASLNYTDPVTGLSGESDSLSVLGTVNVPLFDQLSRQIRNKRNKKLLAVYENLLQNKKVEVTNEIASLLVQRKADQIALEKATVQIEISEKAYKGTWTLLSLGKTDYINVLNAQDVSINAERQWLQTRRRLDSTNANLQLLQEVALQIKNSKNGCMNL